MYPLYFGSVHLRAPANAKIEAFPIAETALQDLLAGAKPFQLVHR